MLFVVKWIEFQISSATIGRIRLFVHVIYPGGGLQCMPAGEKIDNVNKQVNLQIKG